MRYLRDGMEARPINANDYDGMCTLVAWCGGRAVDEGNYVIAVPVSQGRCSEQYGRSGDWLIHGRDGVFWVHADPAWEPSLDVWPLRVLNGLP